MKRPFRFLLLLLFTLLSCDKDKEITHLLNSKKPNELIEGVYEAGNSRDVKYVPLLLKNADKPWASTLLQFKGITVYTECMFSLSKILHVKPPHKFGGPLETADTVNIRFYSYFWQNRMKSK